MTESKVAEVRKDFGRLVRALRLEQRDEKSQFLPWTQELLARETGLSENLIRSIELGRKAQINRNTLLTLAKAFRLTSSERREFFFASLSLETQDIARQQSKPKQALTRVLRYLEEVRLPYFISDNYCDVIRANRVFVTLLNLDAVFARAHRTPAGYNIMRGVFDEEYGYLEMMGPKWEEHAIFNMRYFRKRTLPVRHHDYCQSLLSYLRRYRQFNRYWQEVPTHFDDDQFSGHIGYDYSHPKFGRLEYVASETITLTASGQLSTLLYAPTNRRTAEVFDRIASSSGTGVLTLADWPEKATFPGTTK